MKRFLQYGVCQATSERTATVLLYPIDIYTVSQKIPTFKFSVALTDFQNVRTAGKRMKFATKPIGHYPTSP